MEDPLKESFYEAVKKGELEVAQLIMANGLPHDDDLLNRALFHAVANHKNGVEFVVLLKKAGANINVVIDGRTPLHAAAIVSNYDVFDHLEQLGADTTIKGDVEQTPHELLISTLLYVTHEQWNTKGKSIFEAFLRKRLSLATPTTGLQFTPALLQNCLGIIDKFNLISLLSEESHGYTLMFFFHREVEDFTAYPHIMAYLKKLPVNLKSGAIHPTHHLHAALKANDSASTELLLSVGANPFVKNNIGQLPREVLSSQKIKGLLRAAEIRGLDALQARFLAAGITRQSFEQCLKDLNELPYDLIRDFLKRDIVINNLACSLRYFINQSKIPLHPYSAICDAKCFLDSEDNRFRFIQLLTRIKLSEAQLDEIKQIARTGIELHRIDDQRKTLLDYVKHPLVRDFLVEQGVVKLKPLKRSSASDLLAFKSPLLSPKPSLSGRITPPERRNTL